MRLLIDGVPFTSDGCLRSKSILLGKFGKSNEFAATHIQCITSAAVIQNSHLNRIYDFYEKLVISAQSLDTMNKLEEINGYARLTLDKLPDIRADLVRIDEDQQEWTFSQLVETLRKWTTRNQTIILSHEKGSKHENTYQTNEKNYKHRDHVYCEESGHESGDSQTVNDIEESRLIPLYKKIMRQLYQK